MIGTMNERLVYDFYNECTFSETLSSEGTLRPERATRSYGLIQTFNRTGSLIQTLILNKYVSKNQAITVEFMESVFTGRLRILADAELPGATQRNSSYWRLCGLVTHKF